MHDPALDAYLEGQRRAEAALAGGMPPPPPPESLLPAENLQLPGAGAPAVRIIRPPGMACAAMLHIHGGGFSAGTAAMADGHNSFLARELGIVTVSVEYRLAPAHRHPAARDDCVRAARWLLEHSRSQFGCERLLIGGGSVGASLSVMTLLALRALPGGVARFGGVDLQSGVFDFSMTPSQRHSTPQLFLSPERLRGIAAAAFPGLGPEALRDPAISPLYADLHGLPPAIFSVGTQDAVLDDSLFMAARWQAAGNQVGLQLYPESTHLFMALRTQMAAVARQRIADFLRRCLARPGG